jgi:hypothetical protein
LRVRPIDIRVMKEQLQTALDLLVGPTDNANDLLRGEKAKARNRGDDQKVPLRELEWRERCDAAKAGATRGRRGKSSGHTSIVVSREKTATAAWGLSGCAHEST